MKFKKEITFTAGSRTALWQLEVSRRHRKIKTLMNTEVTRGYAAEKCCMLCFQRVATKISIHAKVIINIDKHSIQNFLRMCPQYPDNCSSETEIKTDCD